MQCVQDLIKRIERGEFVDMQQEVLPALRSVNALRDTLTWNNDNCPGKCGALSGDALRANP